MPDPLARVLIQLDAGPYPSAFDSIVAIDAGADRLLPFHDVELGAVTEIVHGAMFTRGVDQLHRTAIFVGGNDVERGEALFAQVQRTFFGPMRVSVMLDSNGANTTSVAAVRCIMRHLPLEGTTAVVFAGTGPVGQRVARLLGRAGGKVRVGSRSADRAAQVCGRLRQQLAEVESVQFEPWAVTNDQQAAAALDGAEVAVCAGAPGVTLVRQPTWSAAESLKVMIDLNAVPPVGAEGVELADKAAEREGKLAYGAIGVGGLKMKIHRAAIAQLFTANNQVLDAEQIMALAEGV